VPVQRPQGANRRERGFELREKSEASLAIEFKSHRARAAIAESDEYSGRY